MNNIDKLKEAIYNALPRLKDDVVGQIYERNGELYKCVLIRESVVGNTLYYLLDLQDFKTSSYYDTEILNRFEPLGIEPQLNDVIAFLNHLSYSMETYQSRLMLRKWDLSKPLLKDQSEELINYLISLI